MESRAIFYIRYLCCIPFIFGMKIWVIPLSIAISITINLLIKLFK